MAVDLLEAKTEGYDQIGEDIQEEVFGKTIQIVFRIQDTTVTRKTEVLFILIGNRFIENEESMDKHKVIAGVFHKRGTGQSDSIIIKKTKQATQSQHVILKRNQQICSLPIFT